MKPIALIPARGGSKRLPRKNALPFLGRPLIAWPIQAAITANLFSRVIVSTDDPEIASVAKEYGAEVLVRPAEISTDASTVIDVCLHAVDVIRQDTELPEALCCIYATAALLDVNDLLQSYATLESGGFDSVMGVADYELSPFQALSQNGAYWQLRFPEYRSIQSQYYPELVCSAGMMYWIKTSALIEQKTFYTSKMGVQKIPRARLCDINTVEDFQLVEARAALLGRV